MMESGWQFSKLAVRASRGIVAAKHPLAAKAGLEMLVLGGNAIDAAVAAAFAVGVVEPWMSGLGGAGQMVVCRRNSERTPPVAVDFGVRAPGGAWDRMYTLSDGHDVELFGWRAVEEQANVHGPLSVAVPGVPAGLALALDRLGTMPLAQVLRPAITLARDGFPVDWTTTLQVALDATTLRRYADSAALYLPNGGPVVPSESSRPQILRQPDLALTLEAMEAEGPEAFYRGAVGRKIAEGVQRAGGLLSTDDLAQYEARLLPAHVTAARTHEIAIVPGANGGATLVEILNILCDDPLQTVGHNTAPYLHLLIEATRAAFADRLSRMSGGGGWEVVTDPAHAAVRRGSLSAETASAWLAAAPDPTSTTHLCVIDREGTAVSLTQTLLSRFGSRFIAPGTGVLLNNGMMWFDPEPGHPNSVVPGARPVVNMTPAVVMRGGEPVLAVGASGGRRIIDAVLQVILNAVEFSMDAQTAVAAPRIDANTQEVLVDDRIPREVAEDLKRRGHPVAVVQESVAPRFFASPVAISRTPASGELLGGADPYHPAIAAGY